MNNGDILVRSVSKRFRLERNRPSSLKEAILRLGRKRDTDDFWVLKDVSLNIQAGSYFGLIGHNGSGKSTLLRLIAGIHRPTTGSVKAQGRLSALLELGSGFHPDLTGRENVYLNGSMLGLT
ncbi:MAG: ATP-binding cassette domain-containing protein, partial [Acidimicrobiaceae bacterium]|nr:ATP-binding cassette domain-containing protein [Acidimicrobiaceae bacterium]